MSAWATAHPYLFALLFVITLMTSLQFVAGVWSRFLRHLNILRAGWPPPHIDADGDWKDEA